MPVMGMVPIVASADDLPEALRYATLHPSARWYVAGRATALGRAADVPEGWGAPVVAAAEAPDTPEATEPDPATKVELTDDEMVNPLVASASITAEERRKAADSGAALPDGSFPIRSRAELHKAVNLRKNGTASEEKVVGHIRKRAKDLGLEDDEEVVALTAAFGHHEGGPLHEAGKLFNEAMHPRGRDGQFITKGGRVVVIGGDGHKVEGTVEKVDVDATGKAQVHVKTDQGDLTAPAHSIEQAPTAKAHVVRSVDTGPGATPRTTTANAATRKANEAGTAYAHRKAAELHGKAAERSTGGLAVEHHRAAAEHVSVANKYREAEQAHRDAAVDRLTGNAPSGEPRNHVAENLRNAGDEQGARTRERAETGVGVGDRVTHTPTGHSGTVRAVHDDGTASVEYDRRGGIGGHGRSSTADLQRHENQPAPRPTPTTHPDTPTPHSADEQKPIRLEGNDSINLSTGEVTRRPKAEASPSAATGPSHVHFGPRRYEFHDEEANSHKFYESSVIAHSDGTASHVTSWGRIGAKPSYKADQHPDVASAFAAHDKKMAAQERKGYVDIGGSTDTGSAHIAAADRARGGAPARATQEPNPDWHDAEAIGHVEAGWGSHAEAVKAHEAGRPSQALEHVANGRESAEKLHQMGRHDAANDLGTALDDVEEQAGNNVAERGGSPTPYDQHAEEAQRLDEEASANPSAEASRAAAAAHGRAADHAPDLTTAGLHNGIADRHLRDAEAHDAREEGRPDDVASLGTPGPSPHDNHALHGVGKSAVNKGVSDEATAKSRINQILSSDSHEQAHRDLAAMMSEAKLGGKQRARYRELLNQHHGVEGGGRPAGSLSADNPVKERLAAAQAKIREGHPDTGTHPADTRAAEQELVQNTSELGNGFGSQPGAAEMAQHLDRERNNPGGLLGDDATKRANMEKLASSYSDRELGAAINRYPAGTEAGDVARAEKAKRTAPGDRSNTGLAPIGRTTPTSHPDVPDSPAWHTTHHEEEYAGEPTGGLQPIHQTEINGHHILVDEPHTGEGWRYAITPKGDDFAHVRSDDDKSRNLPDHPLSGNFRTADEAKQAAIARARTLRNDAEERDANHRFHEEGLANQVQRERAGRASGDANTIEDAVASQRYHRENIAPLREQGAIPSRSFSTLTNAEQSQLISRFTPAAGSKRDRTANALRFYVEAKSKQERATHGDRGSGLYTDTDRQRLANAEARLKELGIDPKKIRETAQRMIGGPATS